MWAVLLVCVALATRLRTRDALEGMLTLAAFGDSLGSYTELTGLNLELPDRCSCILPLGGSFYNKSEMENDCWGIWPPMAEVWDVALVTDDTAFKLALLEPWLLLLSRHPHRSFNETDFKFFMADHARTLHSRSLTWPQDYFPMMTRNMMSDLVVMMNLAGGGPFIPWPFPGDNVFWLADSPVEFGLYMYLPAAGALAAEARTKGKTLDPFLVFDFFRQFSALDSSYGADVTGLWAALLVDLFATSPSDLSAAFAQRMDHWLEAWPRRHGISLAHIQEYYQLTFSAGTQLRRDQQPESAVVGTFFNLLHNSSLAPNLLVYDPLLDLGLMSISLGYSQGNVVQAMRLISAAPADTDTVGAFFGLFAGAALGKEGVGSLLCENRALENEFVRVRNFVDHFFNYSFAHGVETYVAAGPAIWNAFVAFVTNTKRVRTGRSF